MTGSLSGRVGLRLLATGLLVCASHAHAFVYEDLVEVIRSGNISSIEQVLPHLPAEYLESYTLIHHSRSLHGASYGFPRAILFGKDARLILTFNGDSDQSRYHHLEIMQFRDDERAFELRSISFDDGVKFSAKNPSVCLGCHGNSPGPIWSSYEYSADKNAEHWPGSYGSIHDAPVLNEDEKDAFERFRVAAPEHTRYRYLRLRHPGSQWYPYAAGPHKHRFRPNNRLGNLLARLNAKRLAHHLRQGPFFDNYPGLSMLWLLQCPQASNELVTAFLDDQFRRQYPSMAESADSMTGKPERIRFMFEKMLSGPDVVTWNMSLAPGIGEPRFFTGIVGIEELVAAEIMAGMPVEHWLKKFYLPWTQRDLYDTFRPGYYEANVAPGGVGAEYDSIGAFYDRDHARGACQQLAGQALSEIALAGS